jgi:succinate-semialdehyde dehydrogenase/glutarate-semialdehyde dehydrogenase
MVTATTDTRPAASARIDTRMLNRLAGRAVDPETADRLEVVSPLSGRAIGDVPLVGADAARKAAAVARDAQRAWAELPIAERAAVLLRFHDLVLDRQEEGLDLIQLESGKARLHAFEEILDTANCARYYANTAARVLGRQRRRGAIPLLTASWVLHPPRGLVGLIAPWNYPLTLSITDALPALVAGNGVVLKPDRQTPFTALWGVDLLTEAGMPAEVFQVVTGKGSELAAPIIESVDYLGFTGSTATGRSVAALAGENLIPCSLELGGKNAMLVLDDAALERTVEGAIRACFSSAGQLCISIERLYVQRGIYEAFVDRFVDAAASLRLGAELDFSADMGSLVSAAQLQTVQAHVDDALAKGATVLTGGKARPEIGPYFYEPTVLAGVTPSMALFAAETFGPVVSVYPFDSVDEAVARANDTTYGLNASVWTSNGARGREIAARLRCGTVNVNEGYAAAYGSVDAPMGGFGDSGIGRRHGPEGLVKYTQAQTVSEQRILGLGVPPGLSASGYQQLMTTAMRLLRRLPGVK